ncbi:MAG TPA: fumarylacetoacetate hydrolase family protein [Candidatus Binatia bacterium]|jgi:2-keto-4-pentenoate hydratase/2-oxohepta-3-ene-1,7-dioic acid hydratase in catechol pathway|nr:fumarylacetoacetate hydrolase family protein [Candidatus Binatia bacterium]
MKLATFTHDGTTRIGVVTDDGIVDLAVAAPALPRDMIGFLTAGAAALDAARAAASTGRRLALADVVLEAPIPRPPKFLALGLNYADHVKESGFDTPSVPVMFNKQSTCVTGPYAPIHLPRVSPLLDYEGELAFVIGRRCRHVPRDRAHEVIAGYCIVDDVSVRDWQLRTPTMTMGKSFDTHGPMGPWLVTPDEVGDPHALQLRTWVNGELRQDSNTNQLIFDCFAQVEHLSTAFTLEPGDVVTTGTPSGVGGAMKPPRFLQVGDVVRIEIEKLGAIENTVVAEPGEMVL